MFRFYNTLTRCKEPFVPLSGRRVGIYSCGPTVYRNIHIGNLRTFLLADWLRRALTEAGVQVYHVKNITDVGHMRQEMLDRGEDKVIAQALREGKTPAQIAEFYTEAFLRDEARTNILPAHVFPRASAHVGEMIAIIQRLLQRGLAYQRAGNVYFDVSAFPEYGKLSGNVGGGELLEGVRAEVDPLKDEPRDFALWKAAEPGRALKWPSPWGEGFPGWHIECSAMSTKYLGEEFDIHTGGVDNVFPHHEDEIAQSEGAFGHPVVRCWLHGQHLLVDGLKMAKSTGNVYTLADLEERGFDPLAFRYLCLTAHYRQRLNFTLEALRGAQRALERLREHVRSSDGPTPTGDGAQEWRRRFWAALEDDLTLPQALATVWELARADVPAALRGGLLREFDRVLGLGLDAPTSGQAPLPREVASLLAERARLRAARRFAEADALRQRIAGLGYEVRDDQRGSAAVPVARPEGDLVSSSSAVPSLLETPATAQFSLQLLARDNAGDLRRAVESVLRHAGGHRIEVVVVANAVDDATAKVVQELKAQEPRLRVLATDHDLGTAAARNVGLKQALAETVLLMDTSVELTGDIFTPLAQTLSDPAVGLTGPFGLRTGDLREFSERTEAGEVDAVEAYLLAFRREVLAQVGLLDEKFRFYRHLDLDFSLAVRSRGYRAVLTPGLPLVRHEHREWATTPPEERERLSKRNFYRFLKKWGHRYDLVLDPAGAAHPVLMTDRVRVRDWGRFRDAHDQAYARARQFGCISHQVFRNRADPQEVIIVDRWPSHDALHRFTDAVGPEFTAGAGAEGAWEMVTWEESDLPAIDPHA